MLLQDKFEALIFLVMLIAGIIIYKRKVSSEKDLDKEADYSDISWDTINQLYRDNIPLTEQETSGDDLTIFLDFSALKNKPRYQQAIVSYIRDNPYITFNDYSFEVIYTNAYSYKKKGDFTIKGRLIHLHRQWESTTSNTVKIQNQKNFYGDNTSYYDNSQNTFNDLVTETNRLYEQNKLSDSDLEAIKNLINNTSHNNTSKTDKSNLINRLATYGEATASLIELIKAIVL